MVESEHEGKQLSLNELERLRDNIRVSLEHARDELERIEGLILIARFRDARVPEQHRSQG